MTHVIVYQILEMNTLFCSGCMNITFPGCALHSNFENVNCAKYWEVTHRFCLWKMWRMSAEEMARDSACLPAKSLQLCLTLWDPIDYSLPGFSVHGIFQARILEWVAIAFSRGYSWPASLVSPALAGDSLPYNHQGSPKPQAKWLQV